MSKPLVSIIMPAYNAEKYITASIQSVIGQTYSNWELIAIDDGSSDKTAKIISTFAKQDDRVKYYKNESNKGLIYTRNKGLELANGKYIANLDSDDLAFSERIDKQVLFMESNPEYVLYGSAAEIIDGEGERISVEERNIPDHRLKSLLLFSNYFINSSVIMLARPAKNIGYLFPVTEDYYLATELSKVGKVGNSNAVLVSYRVHESNISKEKEEELKDNLLKIQKPLLKRLNIVPFEKEQKMHVGLVDEKKRINESELNEIEEWLLRLKKANTSLLVYDKESFNYWCSFFYRRACLKANVGKRAFFKYRNSELSQGFNEGLKSNLTFFVKSFFNKT